MYKFNWLAFATIFNIFVLNLNAQEPPIQWGQIPRSDLEMTTFPADSNASAVILCDYGESKFNDDFDIEFTSYQRIKIINENGYEWGTKSIYLYTGKNGQRLADLEGITYSLDENGNIISTELDDDQIFEEEVVEDRLKISFSMPALKPGCVIDIRYKTISESIWYMNGWYFQDNEPVLWSEYRMVYPKSIAYAIISLGYEPWAINEYNEIKQIFNGRAEVYVGKNADCNYYRFAIKNAPALRKEAYITTIEDYINRIDVQLSGYTFGTGVTKVLEDWPTLSNKLLEAESFGESIDPDEVEDLTQSIINNAKTQEDKLNAIYSWITKSIVWTGKNSKYAENDIDDVIELKKGNSAEINFLLISMLRSSGIECDPVILSTRTNGKIQDLYPIVSQFNYVIAQVKIGNKKYLIDATNPLRPINVLPQKILNVRGLVILENTPEWVNISTNDISNDIIIVNLKLATDGSVKVTMEEKLGDYQSLIQRDDIGDKTDLEFFNDYYEPESLGFIVDSAKILNKDDINQSLKIQAGMSSENYSQTGGDMIYLNPYVINRLSDNPFKAKQRKFPIDYSFPRSQTMILNITIPEGYELKEGFEDKTLSTGSKINYTRKKQVDGTRIQILNKLEIKESVIHAKYYEQIKYIYEQMVSCESEMLVIGPKSETSTIK